MTQHDFPEDADGDALRRVLSGESDPARPMAIDFMVAVPSADVGHTIAAEARRRGFDTEVAHDGESDEWTCYCTREMLATYDGIIAAQKELDRLARPFGGHADGWGTWGNAADG